MRVSLIANSGIQFIETTGRIDADSELLKKKRSFAEIVDEGDDSIELVIPYLRNDIGEFIIREAINQDAFTSKGIDEEKIHPDFSIPISEEEIYKISYQEALSIYEETWLPVPILRTQVAANIKHYREGPMCWARMYIAKKSIEKDNTKDTHTIVLAFDTTVADSVHEDAYEMLQEEDVDQSGTYTFLCPTEDEPITNFYAQEWVQDWLREIFADRAEKGIYKDKGNFFSKFAGAYLTLISLLNEVKVFPELSIYGHTTQSIDVSLVIDIGNSRTCGLILETSEVGINKFPPLLKAEKLAIRDLSQPNKSYHDPFEMRVAFVEERFGDKNYTTEQIGNQTLFSWPSLIRIGPEAARLIALNGSGQEAPFYLSSPKRYLWDTSPYDSSWKSVKINTDGKLEFDSAFFGIAHNFTESGKLIMHKPSGVERVAYSGGRPEFDYSGRGERILKDEVRIRRPIQEKPIASVNAPRYSRASLMTFSIFELLLQALSQINSFSYRKKIEGEGFPRRLKNLVLTCPTAMTQTDQRNLRNAADDAIDLLKLYFDESFIDESLQVIPAPVNTLHEAESPKNWMYDEATCSHLAYLYGEIYYRFNKDIPLYFKYSGKNNPALKYTEEKSTTIASIDIGGGTTDVMICAYQLDPESHGAVIEPQPLFWEGFNLAGDDLMRRIIERTILPQIYEYAVQCGCDKFRAKALMSDLFGPHTGESFNIKDIRLKNLVVNQVITPISYTVIDYLTESQSSDILKFNDFFYSRPRPNNTLIQQVNQKFVNNGATGFDIEKMSWRINVEAINQVIYQTIGKLLSHISSIVAQYACDVVLLAGKPTKIPVIKEILVRNLPVSPDKIVTLGNYRIGNWYPFSNSFHEINDPKTIVCVGAAISHMSEMGKLGTFRFNTEPLKQIRSTANYIGKYTPNSAKINEEDVFLSVKEESAMLKFSGSDLIIGKRQLADSNWLAAPIYQIRYRDDNAAIKLVGRGLKPPYIIIIERAEMNKEELTYEKIAEDRDGNEFNFDDFFVLAPQSLADEYGYWLDTGCFSLDIIDRKG